MTLRRSLVVLASSAAMALVHVVLVRAMAEGHVAHVLLGAGNGPPPVGAALLAVLLVVVRFLTIVVAPGAALAAIASIAAHRFVGPIDGAEKEQERQGGAEPASKDSSGTNSSDGAGLSVSTGAGTTIDGRATQ